MLINIDFELDNSEVELGKSVTGSFIWQGSTVRKSISVDVSVGWRTQGRGEEDRAMVSKQSFVEVEPDVIIPFVIDLPMNAPPSYNGKLIRIIWKVTVKVYIHGFLGKFGNQTEEFSKPLKVFPFRS